MGSKIVIIGAGPTGLGAAYRLQEHGYRNWEIYERNSHIGGLASSYRDKKEFIWDIGAHAIYSHYEYIDRLLDDLLGDDFILHRRDTWIWALNHWIPYPFQNNIRFLPKEKVVECLIELFRAHEKGEDPDNFEKWIISTFGAGIAKYFMTPYNRKLWAYPLDKMDMDWLAHRVSLVDIEKLLRNVVYEQNDIEWGPNVEFKIPAKGGTGALFNKMIPQIQDHLILDEEMVSIDLDLKEVRFSSGRVCNYDYLLNTIPLDRLIQRVSPVPDYVNDAAGLLEHNGLVNVGIGLNKPCPSDKTWVYFPEDNCPFHRVSYLSNYSPDSVPDPETHYSMICEISYSGSKSIDMKNVIQQTVDGLVNTGMIDNSDREAIVSTHLTVVDYAYPIPTIDYRKTLRIIHPYLESKGVHSRGRFGAWTYKFGNLDHSIVQGVEAVDRFLSVEDKVDIRQVKQ